MDLVVFIRKTYQSYDIHSLILISSRSTVYTTALVRCFRPSKEKIRVRRLSHSITSCQCINKSLSQAQYYTALGLLYYMRMDGTGKYGFDG